MVDPAACYLYTYTYFASHSFNPHPFIQFYVHVCSEGAKECVKGISVTYFQRYVPNPVTHKKVVLP